LLLNLGCGGKKLDGYVNVDRVPNANPDVVLDIGRDVFPWPDNSVEGIQIWHVLEHMHPEQFIHCLKEMYRVCVAGALVGIIVPHPRHDVFVNDPTHVHAVTPAGMAIFSKKHDNEIRAMGAEVTSYSEWLGVDFELQEPVTKVLDPHVDPRIDKKTLDEMERTMNNIIVEYRFKMKVMK
jgi:predicted SAM-dependent methyltransferase